MQARASASTGARATRASGPTGTAVATVNGPWSRGRNEAAAMTFNFAQQSICPACPQSSGRGAVRQPALPRR